MSTRTTELITPAEMAKVVTWAMIARLGTSINIEQAGEQFTMTAPATGQRFRISVEEVQK